MSLKSEYIIYCALCAVARTVLDNSHRDRRVDDRSYICSTVAYPEPHHEIEGQSSLKQMQRSEENKRDVTGKPNDRHSSAGCASTHVQLTTHNEYHSTRSRIPGCLGPQRRGRREGGRNYSRREEAPPVLSLNPLTITTRPEKRTGGKEDEKKKCETRLMSPVA